MTKVRVITLGMMVCVCGWTSGTPSARAGEEVKLFPIVKDGLWGYMDDKGKVVIEPQYQGAWDFHEGLACVAVKALRGYIDAKGEMVIKPQFGWAGPFSEGLAFVNRHKNMYGEHVEWYKAVTGTGFCDRTGKVVMNLGYNTRATDFHDGCSWTGKNFVDAGGKPVSCEAAAGSEFSEGMAVAAANKGGPWGYVSRDTMKFAIQPQFTAARAFSDGMAAVAEGSITKSGRSLKWGYVDKSGKQAIDRKFEDAGPFSEGLAPVRAGGKWGYVDKTGKMVVDAKYDCAWRFSEGLGRVLVGDKQGYVDKTGKMAIEARFDAAWEFNMGLGRVQVEEKEGYIDHGGKYVWEPTNFWPPQPAPEAAKEPAK